VKSDICVKVKMQSKLQPKDTPELAEFIADPTQTVIELKVLICSKYSLHPYEHKFYLTD
jgi:hypothetical protein